MGAKIYFLSFCTLFMTQHQVELVSARQTMYTLSDASIFREWRLLTGKPQVPEKALIWQLNEQVGIGNALGGFSEALLIAISEGREIIVQSTILEKFCKIVSCSLREIIDDKRYFKTLTDVIYVSPFHIDVNSKPDPSLVPLVLKLYPIAGCIDLPLGYDPEDRDVWLKMCLYSKIIRGLIIGDQGFLQERKDWVKQYYVGDSDRFEKVMTMANRRSAVNSHTFDAAIHIRTISLLEDLSMKNGMPKNQHEKTIQFIESKDFKSMVNCFALNMVSHVKNNHLQQHHIKHTISSTSSDETSRSELTNNEIDNMINIYLASDTPGMRSIFAQQISNITTQLLNQQEYQKKDGDKVNWTVHVDYFNASLPPAHFYLWTENRNEVDFSEDKWNRLVGTTAEWLFISEARRTLMVKGLVGGQKALVSSFSTSAAAFGQTEELKFLIGSRHTEKGCQWQDIAFF